MKIIMSKNESATLDMLLHNVEPDLEREFHSSLSCNPLVNIEVLDDGYTSFEMDEEYVVKMMGAVADDAKAIIPLGKSIFHLLCGTRDKLTNITKTMFEKARERRSAMAKAKRDMVIGQRMVEDAQKAMKNVTTGQYHVCFQKPVSSD